MKVNDMRASSWFVLAAFFAALGIASMSARVINSKVKLSQPEPMYLKMADGHCSGAYLGNGFAITAYHCLEDTPPEWQGGDLKFNLDVVWTSKDHDMALLRNTEIDKMFPGLQATKFTCVVPEVGDAITAAGYPADLGLVHIRGYVAGKAKEVGRWKSGVPAILPIFFGNSGGPAYNSRGEMFALTVGLLDTPISILTPLSAVCDILPRR